MKKLTPKMAVVGALTMAGQAAHGQSLTLQGIGTFYEVGTSTGGTVPITDWGVIADPPNVSYPYLELREYFAPGGGFDQRVFIKVNLSSVPAGSAVTGAKLGLYWFDSTYGGYYAAHSDYVDLWSTADEFTMPTNTTYDGSNLWTDGPQAGVDGFARSGPPGRHLGALYHSSTAPGGAPSNLVIDQTQEYKVLFDHDRDNIDKFDMDALDEYLTQQVLAGKDAYFQLSIGNADGAWQRFVSTSDDGTYWTSQTGNAAFSNQPKLELNYAPFVPTWHLNDGGDWTAPAGNWYANVVPDGVDQSAKFGSYIQGSITVNVDSPKTVGHLIFDSVEQYTIGGANAVTLDVSSGSASIDVLNGSHVIAAPLLLQKDTAITVNDSAALLVSDYTAATGVALSKEESGVVTLTHARADALNVNGGTVQIAAQADPYSAAGSAGVSKVSTLTVGASAQLNITNNKLITQDPVGTATPDGFTGEYIYDGVLGLVQKGRGDGTWNGIGGIVTSETDATTSVLTGIAVSTGANRFGLGATETALWAGQTVNGDSTLVMYTWGGDAQLDGDLDGDDYFQIDSNVAQSGSVFGYDKGDFNYDGLINGDDYFIIDSNIAAAQASGNVFYTSGGAGGGAGGAAGLTAVPEPGAITLLGIAACGLAARRRRRSYTRCLP